MVSALDEYFIQKEEPDKSCLQSLRDIILSQDGEVTETWKYGMPVYCIRGKMFCYLRTHKKYKQPYIGIVEGARIHHPELIQGKACPHENPPHQRPQRHPHPQTPHPSPRSASPLQIAKPKAFALTLPARRSFSEGGRLSLLAEALAKARRSK